MFRFLLRKIQNTALLHIEFVSKISKQEENDMEQKGHVIDKDNVRHSLSSINSLLSQAVIIAKQVNKDEQWDYCTDNVLAERVSTAEKLTKELSDIVFQKRKGVKRK